MSIYEKLAAVQSTLKAPKSQYNDFGKYKYRNCEDIIEAVKPLLKANGLLLTLTDELVMVGERYYVKATATVFDTNIGGNHIEQDAGHLTFTTPSTITVTAYAREEETKKGMDGSQITGASSSYARKYALNGLFAIDDNKDSDTTNTGDRDNANTGDGKTQKMETVEDAANYVLDFGKHKGETLGDVFKTDRGYLQYLYDGGNTEPIIKTGISILLRAAINSINARAE